MIKKMLVNDYLKLEYLDTSKAQLLEANPGLASQIVFQGCLNVRILGFSLKSNYDKEKVEKPLDILASF